MKNIRSFIILLFCAFLIACSSKQPETETIDVTEDTARLNAPRTLIFNDHNLSFIYPTDWMISEVMAEDKTVKLVLGERNRLDYIESFNLTWIEGEHDLNQIINQFYAPFAKNYPILEKDSSKIIFKDRNCISFDFAYAMPDDTLYSNIMVFYVEGNTVAILKQSNSKNRLTDEFMLMENSLQFKQI